MRIIEKKSLWLVSCPYLLSFLAELLVSYSMIICLMAKVKEIKWLLLNEILNGLFLLIQPQYLHYFLSMKYRTGWVPLAS